MLSTGVLGNRPMTAKTCKGISSMVIPVYRPSERRNQRESLENVVCRGGKCVHDKYTYVYLRIFMKLEEGK